MTSYFRFQKRIGDRCLTDPVLSEEAAESTSGDVSCLTIGYQPSLEQTVQILQEGNISPKTVLSDIQHLVISYLYSPMKFNSPKLLHYDVHQMYNRLTRKRM